MPAGRQLIPGWFSWARSIEYGSKVGATPNGRRKGEALGADAQLSKPEIGNLVRIVDTLVKDNHLDASTQLFAEETE